MKFITSILAWLFVQVTLAQNITVENFTHIKHYFWQHNPSISLDKKNATVLLKTEIKGFDFKTAKGNPIEAIDGDNGITLKVPDKSKYIVISHPDYGDFDWRVPVKNLKKHNYYAADLLVTDLTKEYKNPNQWLSFKISPKNSILTLDSVIYRITEGEISLYLPVDKHSFIIESPFYEEFADSINLTDSKRIEKDIYLQPLYSYLVVKSEDPGVEIYIDEQLHGSNEVTIGRLTEGNHRLSLLKNNSWVKDTIISIESSEKKTVIIPYDLKSNALQVASEKFEKNPNLNIYREKKEIKKTPSQLISELKDSENKSLTAEIHLIAEDSLTQIKIDREIVGTGEWRGNLNRGFHLLSTEKNGEESISQYIEITEENPKTIFLATPKSAFGMLNINSNVTDAEIIIEDVNYGFTPSIVKNLRSDELYTITLHKDGYKDKSVTVRTKGNAVEDVYIELKRE